MQRGFGTSGTSSKVAKQRRR